MKLTRQQLTKLKDYQSFRERPLTLAGILRRSWLSLLIAAIMGAVALVMALTMFPILGWVLVGFVAGGIFCILVAAQSSVQSWPMQREILHWSRVEELIRENENRNA